MKVDTVVRDPHRKLEEIVLGLTNNLDAANNFAPDGSTGQVLTSNGPSTPPSFQDVPAVDVSGVGQVLVRINDTNVTVTLSGEPQVALLAPVTMTIGWSGTLAASRGGTGRATLTSGSLLYGNAANPVSQLALGTSGYWLGAGASAPQYNAPAALTKTDDTNVTLTLGGSPATALLNAASLTLGWTGQLGVSRGGTGASLSATGGAHQVLQQASIGGSITVGQLAVSDISGGAALSRVNDTNVTLTLGGTPTTALLAATSLTLGWTGQLALSRGGTNADLSATGGTSNVLKQVSIGASITVAQLGFADLSGKISNAQVDNTVTYTNLIGVGAITTGTWTATPVDATHGGTAQSAWTTGDLLYASAANTLSRLAVPVTDGWVVTYNSATGLPEWRTGGGGAVSSVAGTAGQITVSPTTGNVVVGIDSTYVGQTSITKVGNITVGSWAASTIPLDYTVAKISSVAGTVGKISVSGPAFQKNAFQAYGFQDYNAVAAGFQDLSTAFETDAFQQQISWGDVVITIDPTYVGQTSITTLGTVSTGAWQATKVGLLYGGTNADLSATGGVAQYLKQGSTGAAITVGTIPASDVVSGAALTEVDDTNITLLLGGSASTALLAATSLTLGWTGTLAAARLNSNVVQGITNDTNVTGSITAQVLTFGWSGQLATSRGGTGVASFTNHAAIVTTSTSAIGYVVAGTAGHVMRSNGTDYADAQLLASDIGSGAALTKTDDTNVTLTLGGSPTSALLAAASVTAGWTGQLAVGRGGTGLSTFTAAGAIAYSTAATTLAALAANSTATNKYLQSVSSGNPTWQQVATSDLSGAAALTKTDDTNVTLTLGGTPSTALLVAASITVGWTGTLGLSRGGTNANLSATGGTHQVLQQASAGAAITVGQLVASDISSGAALTKTDDTNVTLTLGGTPASALLVAASLTLGWTGTLSLTRGGTAADLSATGGAKQYVKQATLGGAFTIGTIPASDIASGAALTQGNDTNVTLTLGGSPSTALLTAVSITAGWTGQLGLARGGSNADLSATGGASQVLKQVSSGAAITVGQLAFTDISSTVAQAQLPTGNVTWDVGVGNALTLTQSVAYGSTVTFNGIVYTWPASQSAGAFLKTDGSGGLSWSAVSGGAADYTVVDVSGTTNQITVSTAAFQGNGFQNPGFQHVVVGMATTYAGQTSITTLGQVSIGAWVASVIGISYTEAKVASVTGTTNRVIVSGSAFQTTGFQNNAFQDRYGQFAGFQDDYADGVAGFQTSAFQQRVSWGDITVDISPNYGGQTSITTLGTIATGTWSAGDITTANLTVSATATVSGVTITGAPTWTSNQSITLSTAAQPNVTSLGTLTALAVAGRATFFKTATASSETTFPIAAGKADGTSYVIIGYDSTSDFGVVAAVNQGVSWKTLHLNPYGGAVVIDGAGTVSGSLTVSAGAAIGSISGNLLVGTSTNETYIGGAEAIPASKYGMHRAAATGELVWGLNGADNLQLTTADLSPRSAALLTLGTASLYWSTTFSQILDSASGDLTFKRAGRSEFTLTSNDGLTSQQTLGLISAKDASSAIAIGQFSGGSASSVYCYGGTYGSSLSGYVVITASDVASALIVLSTSADGTGAHGSITRVTVGAGNAGGTSGGVQVYGEAANLAVAPTGGDKGPGTINVATNIYLNGAAYTNPDYVFEHWAVGVITRFAQNEGASAYTGLSDLRSVESFVRQNWALPRLDEARMRNHGAVGLFDGGDAILASLEESYLYLFDHERRITALECVVK